jgi:O-antigen ligase
MFLPNKFWRRVLVTIGVAGALTSGSRAAFLFLPLLFLPSIIYYYRIRILTMILILGLLLTGLFLVSKNETLLALTFGRKGEEITNLDSLELAQKSAEGRGALREIGMDYIKDKPWGYGYGQSFEVVLDGKSLGNNLHNGYLNVATQMGVHIFLIYIGFFIWLFYNLVNTGRISRRSRFFTLSILSCVFLRAISESFSLFDLGHPASFFCLFLICLFINRFNSRAEQLA